MGSSKGKQQQQSNTRRRKKTLICAVANIIQTFLVHLRVAPHTLNAAAHWKTPDSTRPWESVKTPYVGGYFWLLRMFAVKCLNVGAKTLKLAQDTLVREARSSSQLKSTTRFEIGREWFQSSAESSSLHDISSQKEQRQKIPSYCGLVFARIQWIF